MASNFIARLEGYYSAADRIFVAGAACDDDEKFG